MLFFPGLGWTGVRSTALWTGPLWAFTIVCGRSWRGPRTVSWWLGLTCHRYVPTSADTAAGRMLVECDTVYRFTNSFTVGDSNICLREVGLSMCRSRKKISTVAVSLIIYHQQRYNLLLSESVMSNIIMVFTSAASWDVTVGKWRCQWENEWWLNPIQLLRLQGHCVVCPGSLWRSPDYLGLYLKALLHPHLHHVINNTRFWSMTGQNCRPVAWLFITHVSLKDIYYLNSVHIHIHTLMAEAAMQDADCSSGAI